MAYLKELVGKCEFPRCCKKTVIELISCDNYNLGRYCRQHGNIKLRERIKMEGR